MWPCRWPKCYYILNWFFLPKPGYFKFIWVAEITFKSISPTFWIQILPNKLHFILPIKILVKFFKFLWNFQVQFNLILVKKSFNIHELLHHKSIHHGTKPMHPSSSRAFQRDQKHDLKHPGWVDLISTNKTKQTTFLHR